MSEKMQHTAASLQHQMASRYNDGLHHKHNKYHLLYRMHYRSHPCNQEKPIEQGEFTGSTGLLHAFKLKKTRKRVHRGEIH